MASGMQAYKLVRLANLFPFYSRRCLGITKPFYIIEKRNKSTAALSIEPHISDDILRTETEETELDFEDYKRAFKAKTTWEIIRALVVYKICSIDTLINYNKELIQLSRTLLGKRGFELLMKNSFYGHFVAGETQEVIKDKLQLMQSYGVGAILDYAVEADIPKNLSVDEEEKKEDTFVYDLSDVAHRYQAHSEFLDRRERVFSARTYFYEGEEKCDKNMEVFLQCIETTGNTAEDGFAAIKVTALGRPALLLRMSQILNQTRHYFNKLVSRREDMLTKCEIAESCFWDALQNLGVEMSKKDAHDVFNIMDLNKDGGIDFIEWNNFLTPRLQLSKLFRAQPKTKGTLGEEFILSLTDEELLEMDNLTRRMFTIAEHAKKRGVRLLVDAEQTYFQPAITRITLDAMRHFNKEKPVVFNTYQCYQKDALNLIEIDIEISRREHFHYGAKVVRGAYMEQERLRAESLGYEDPIHDSYVDTNNCYNKALSTVLEEVAVNNANLMIATHNEESVRHAVKLMKKYSIDPTSNTVFFGQLLGMCDVVTYALGSANYSAYKYVPYGAVDLVMPYLSRRAMENRSLMDGVQKERGMLWSELIRRYKEGNLKHDPAVQMS